MWDRHEPGIKLKHSQVTGEQEITLRVSGKDFTGLLLASLCCFITERYPAVNSKLSFLSNEHGCGEPADFRK